jgi:hypothetical protein
MLPQLAKNEVMDMAKGTRTCATCNLQGTRLWRVRMYLLGSFRIISWAKLAVWRRRVKSDQSLAQKNGDSNLSNRCKIRTGIPRQRIHVYAVEADLAGQHEKIPLHDARCTVTSDNCLVLITHVKINETCFLFFV